MEEKTVSFVELKRKLKIEEAKRKVKEGAKGTLIWCMNNKELALGLAASGVAGLRILSKMQSNKHEDQITYCRHWDPRAGMYTWSRRKLNRKEMLELDERYRAGESKLQILNDMGTVEVVSKGNLWKEET